MPTFTVHAPPPQQGEAASAPERFVFVRDGFHVWAFVLAPLWLLWHRLWLALLGYLVVSFALGLVLFLLGVSAQAQWPASLLVALLIGFEAATLWRWTLGAARLEDARLRGRRGSRNGRAALLRRLGQPRRRAAGAARRFAGAAIRRRPVRRGPPSPTDVIGLFPEPGLPR